MSDFNDVFGVGEPNEAYAQYFEGKSYLSELTYYDQFLLIKIDQFSKDNLLYAENTSF